MSQENIQREAFEAKYVEGYDDVEREDLLKRYRPKAGEFILAGVDYERGATQKAWEWWQAALQWSRRAAPAPAGEPELVKALEEVTFEIVSDALAFALEEEPSRSTVLSAIKSSTPESLAGRLRTVIEKLKPPPC